MNDTVPPRPQSPHGSTKAEHLTYNPKEWPELQSPAYAAERQFAEAMAKREATALRQRLVTRARVLVAVVVLSLVAASQTLLVVVPQLWGGGQAFDAVLTPVACLNAILQVTSSGYFLLGRDPDFAMQIIKMVLIFNGLELFMGFVYAGSLPLTIVNIVLLYVSYNKLSTLRWHLL